MERYTITLAVIGLAALGMAWMPRFTERTGISYAIIYVGAGFLLYHFFPSLLASPDPRVHTDYTVHLTELVVLVSLIGTGIKIDRVFSFRGWRTPIRLVTVTMLLCIAGCAMLGYWLAGLGMASSLLLGAILAPTDPVLASDVQVGPPNEKRRFEIKFSLTAEAGLNDGAAFPFVWLAILVAGSTGLAFNSALLTEWLSYHLAYKIIGGVAIGFLLGRLTGYLLFRLSAGMGEIKDGFVALSMTLLVYGIAELAHAYGFIAVFIAAITVRHYEKEHKFHNKMHAFADQTERSMIAILLLLFGGSLTTGILDGLTWPMVGISFLFLFIVRPVAAYLSLWGLKLHPEERLVIGFFGIRGMGTIYYLSYALTKTSFPMAEALWTIATFTILVSLLLHGVTATRVMKKMEEKYAVDTGKKTED